MGVFHPHLSSVSNVFGLIRAMGMGWRSPYVITAITPYPLHLSPIHPHQDVTHTEARKSAAVTPCAHHITCTQVRTRARDPVRAELLQVHIGRRSRSGLGCLRYIATGLYPGRLFSTASARHGIHHCTLWLLVTAGWWLRALLRQPHAFG